MRTYVRGGGAITRSKVLAGDPEHNVIAAEAAAFELKQTYPLPLDFAIALVHLYAEKRDPKFEPAALRYLARYITEESPSLTDVAGTAALLDERVGEIRR